MRSSHSASSTRRAAVLIGLTLFFGSWACSGGPGLSEERPHTDAGLPDTFLRGVNHAHIHRRGNGYGSEISRAELADLHALGVRSIAITPFGYQDGATAEEIRGFPGNPGASEFFAAHDDSMTDTDLLLEMEHARELGMTVVVKPQIWSRDFWEGHEWHGTVRQESAAAHRRWWASYRNFILHYARLAIRGRAATVCVGTELVEMSTGHPEEWRALIADIRALPGGGTLTLTYCAHWDRELTDISFWDALDTIGVGAYFPLDAPERATVKELVEAWTPHRHRLKSLSSRWKKSVVFLEAGYRAVSGNHRRPWEYSGGESDSQAQANSYEAMFEALHHEIWWAGVYFWKTFTDPELASVRGDAPQFGFRSRPAEMVVERWFTSSYSRQTKPRKPL